MQERYGQLAKKIVGRALPSLGALYVEHEIPLVDAQAGDIYFVPEPGMGEAERADLGWLGQVTLGACLLEMVQMPPGPRVVRGNVRKQLTLDHLAALEAAKRGLAEPPLLSLWMFSAGCPRDVLDGYDFRPVKGWPRGFWQRSRLDAVGIVVLSELPRQRDTLLLRLLGRGKVLRDAIADLKDLPPGAKEREIAHAPLVALQFEVKQDPHPDKEAKAYLMATQELFEQWEARTKAEAHAKGEAIGEAKGRKKGVSEGLMAGLISIHEDRFGPMPDPMRKALARRVTANTFRRWLTLFLTAASADEIGAAIRRGLPTG